MIPQMQPLYYWLKRQLIRRKLFLPNTDIYIVSYPKSGRTWLRLMLGKAICERYNLPDEDALDTYALTRQTALPITHFSHDFSSILAGLPYKYYPKGKSAYAGKRVIFLMRDVRDVLVSSYFQATRRTWQYNRHLSDFIRDERYGIRKVITFYNSWYDNQAVPAAFLQLTYEEMHADPAQTVRHLLHFIDFPAVDDELVETAVHFAKFENMQRMEQRGIFETDRLKPGNQRDIESYKVRRGVVGGYANYLSSSDLHYINQIVNEMGCPFLDPYFGEKL